MSPLGGSTNDGDDADAGQGLMTMLISSAGSQLAGRWEGGWGIGPMERPGSPEVEGRRAQGHLGQSHLDSGPSN